MTCTETDNVVAQVLGGDIDAYEGIVHRYQLEVWKVVAAMLLNAERTEDLVQQTFIKAFQHLHRYERGRDFGAWLKEIARNEVRQEIRRYAWEDRRLGLYHSHLMQTYEGPLNSAPEDFFEEALQECTQKLPPASAKLVELRYQSALNFGEIAASLGRTVAATRQQLGRIRLSLRDCIEKHMARS
jgi:RNA polymerase sigma-70 factor (ECF subfamily)